MKLLRLLAIIMLFSSVALGHSGRTDSIGGHNNTQEGNYHFHSGPLAGQTFDSKEAAEAALEALEDDPPSGGDPGGDPGGGTPLSGLLEIHYINVQQGGSTLIIGPNGTTILMDAGNNGKGTSEVVPYLQSIGLSPQDGLDYTLGGHLDADHVGGFDDVINAGYDVRIKNYFNGSTKSTATVESYKSTLTQSTTAGAPVKIPLGHTIPLGNGAILTVIAVAGDVIGVGHVAGSENNENDLSVAVLIQYANFDFIWASDLGGGDNDNSCTGRSTGQVNLETSIAQSITFGGSSSLLFGDGVDVMHVNHHGSESSTNSDWKRW